MSNDKSKSGQHPVVREFHRTLQVAQAETETRCAASERRMEQILQAFLADEDSETRDTQPSLPEAS